MMHAYRAWGIVAILLGITTYLWYNSLFEDYGIFEYPLYDLNHIAALWSVALFSFTFFLSSRLSILEQLFGGLDRVYRLHKQTANIAFLLAVAHFLLLVVDAWQYGNGVSFYLFSINENYLIYGRLSLVLFTLLIILTIFVKLPYHIWKRTHEFMGLAFLLAILHMLESGSDVTRSDPLKYWMLGLSIVGLGSFVWIRFLYQFFGQRHNYLVEEVRQKGSITELIMKPQGEQKALQYQPGQFLSLRLEHLPEPHPFSISSGPSDDFVRLSIKALGDFTTDIGKVRPGEKAVLHGPYGRFFEALKIHPQKPVILIAGGIGITPFISLLRSDQLQDRSTDFFYLAKNHSDAVYDEEIQDLIKGKNNFRYFLHFSDTEGYMSAEKINQEAPLKDHLIFLCGPPVMMHLFRKQFLQLGLKQSQIIFEDFSFK